MSHTHPTALIAEDEPLLAQALQAELARAWPALEVVAVAGDGASAVQQALQRLPDVLFFDVRMPALNGLDAAAQLADEWPHHGPDARPFPALVFVTAYDQYAVQAFEAQAVDYLLKPVEPARLQKTVAKVQQTLAGRDNGAINLEATLDQLRGLLQAGRGPDYGGGGHAAQAHPGRRRHGHPPGAGGRGALLRSGRQIRARHHARP